MTDYVALFRGINVGGRHILPMQELRGLLTALGCDNVKTIIQSGNAVFSAEIDPASLSLNIANAIDEKFGFTPQVLLLRLETFEAIVAANPYPEAAATPKFLHVWFLTEKVDDPDVDAMNDLKADSEKFILTDSTLYLFAPDGIGRSRLAARVDHCLGVPTTARNWRTVTKLIDLADQLATQPSPDIASGVN